MTSESNDQHSGNSDKYIREGSPGPAQGWFGIQSITCPWLLLNPTESSCNKSNCYSSFHRQDTEKLQSSPGPPHSSAIRTGTSQVDSVTSSHSLLDSFAKWARVLSSWGVLLLVPSLGLVALRCKWGQGSSRWGDPCVMGAGVEGQEETVGPALRSHSPNSSVPTLGL